ncbi:hypothetical protein C0J52_13286 [Blattella germanica]|nr:hypothetical protein C0J52_13286 [Blattella germanica]
MDSGPNVSAPATSRPDDEPLPGCSLIINSTSLISPVVQILHVRELLTPEEDNGKHSKRITTARCVTSLNFLREMEEEENKSAKRRREESSSEDNENGDNTCGECSGAFEDDFRG